MPECIFCQEDGIDLPSDCKICPECGSPPFSGMMFDAKRKEEAERQESEGDFIGAWKILSEEWMAHTDIDYFDDEMAVQLNKWIDELFDRNPEMIEQRVEMKLMVMKLNTALGDHDGSLNAAEEAMRLAREADRPDLELEALEMHGSIQSQRYGGIENMPQYNDFCRLRSEIEARNHDS